MIALSSDMKLYNSLSKNIEEFVPLNAPHVGMYTCGPTVYSYATIGNFRTYLTSDLVVRALKFSGYNVEFIMNLTDVGHLTGDNEGDADTGEDRLEKSAKKEGKTAWDIADFYTKAFIKDFDELNLTKPQSFMKATEHIPEQIELIQRLQKNGFVYQISDGLYFDTVSYEKITGRKYGELSSLDKILEGARVEPNLEKKNPRDFALWKFSPENQKRQMEWDSPWGIGFPGWHIECSAMSMEKLGETFDIHTGGEDLRATHHPNEIAQSEGATGKLFVKYWMHSAFLKVDGKRMGKSLGNAYTLTEVKEKGYDAMALRYFYMTGHYRSPLNFTWEALSAAQNALNKLRATFASTEKLDEEMRTELSEEKLQKITDFRQKFTQSLNDDLNTSEMLSVLWEVAKSNIPSPDKRDLLLLFDEVLGLQLDVKPEEGPVPSDVLDLFEKRKIARENKAFFESDTLRDQISAKGYTVKDSPDGTSKLSKSFTFKD